jgi:hypothetical protein
MPEDDLEKLLGGFAADTLTPEEKQRLYNTALHDQQLFNLFADEQALKELLTDPVVREKLLRSLRDTTSTTVGGNASWFGWFSRPAGLAWAGGLAAALSAVVLGTNIYQDSLREAGYPVADDKRPANMPAAPAPSTAHPTLPSTGESRVEAEAKAKRATSLKKETLTAKPALPETEAIGTPRGALGASRTKPDALRDSIQSISQAVTPSKEDALDSIDHERASTPLISDSAPASTKLPAPSPPTGQAGSGPSARSLYYGQTAEVTPSLMTEVQERQYHAQPFERHEQKKSSTQAGQTGSTAEATKPLGIRYSLKNHGMEKSHSDRNAGASMETDSIDLMIEANQDSFFQVWGEVNSLQPHLLFPFSTEDPVSSRLMAYQLRRIPILAGYRSVVVRVSLMPFGAASIKDSDAMTQSTLEHREESTTSIGASGSQGHVTYVVNQTPSATILVVRIPTHQP